MDRRTFLKMAAGAAMGAGSLLEACTSGSVPRPGPVYPRLILQLGDAVSPPNPVFTAEEYFRDLVQVGTNGATTVDLRPNSELGNEAAMLPLLVSGSLSAARISTHTLAGVLPQIAVWDLPFAFIDQGHMRSAEAGRLGQATADLLRAKGIVPLAWFDGQPSYLITGAPVQSPADLKGRWVVLPEAPNPDGSPPNSPLFRALSGLGAVPLSPAITIVVRPDSPRRVQIGYQMELLLASASWLDSQPKRWRDRILAAGRDTEVQARILYAQADALVTLQPIDRPSLLDFQRSPAVQQVWSEVGPGYEPLYSLLRASI